MPAEQGALTKGPHDEHPEPELGGEGKDVTLDLTLDRVVGNLDGVDAARSPSRLLN